MFSSKSVTVFVRLGGEGTAAPSPAVFQTITSLSFCHSVLCIQYNDFSPHPPPPALFFKTELDIYLLCLCSSSLLHLNCPLRKHECTFPRDFLPLIHPERKLKLSQSDAKT